MEGAAHKPAEVMDSLAAVVREAVEDRMEGEDRRVEEGKAGYLRRH